MTVPETAVNEDNFSPAGEHEVRHSWKARDMEPVPVPTGMSDPSHQEFGLCVLAPDERHPLAALKPR